MDRKWSLGLRGISGTASFVVVSWCAYMAINEVLLHGFAPICADGHPEFNSAYCGITWQPGLPYLAFGALGLVVLAVSCWNRFLTRYLLLVGGLGSASLALILLWSSTWDPVNPDHVEPAGPQLVLLAAGAAAVLVAGVYRPLRP